jgi:hypothetical protein
MSSSEAQIAVIFGFFGEQRLGDLERLLAVPGRGGLADDLDAGLGLEDLHRGVHAIGVHGAGTPSRTIRSPFALPLPPSFSTMNSALFRPNALLSPSMKMSATGLEEAAIDVHDEDAAVVRLLGDRRDRRALGGEDHEAVDLLRHERLDVGRSASRESPAVAHRPLDVGVELRALLRPPHDARQSSRGRRRESRRRS